MIGTKVFAIDGAGQSPQAGLAASEGIIISDLQDRWGDWWIILWTDGNAAGQQEPFSKHTLKHVSMKSGIGVYHA